MGIVRAVCTSQVKGTQKRPEPFVRCLVDWGIEGDAHGGRWHRQVSLLSQEKIEEFRRRGAPVSYGDFGENIVAEGIDFSSLPVGTLFRCGDVLLEMTQIGKECHSHCAIYQAVGDCIMPREGVFARVLEGGVIRPGDEIVVEPRRGKRPYQAAVITLSDKGSRGERKDESGPVVAEALRQRSYDVVEELLLPDGMEPLKKELMRLADQRQLDLIFAVATRQAPGIAEAMRAASLAVTKRSMLSRAVSVIRGKTLIVNLPGSPKACRECMDVFLDTIPHGLDLLRGDGGDCAR